MTKTTTFNVCVPATSANLGTGFDSLGLALDLFASIEISFESEILKTNSTGGERLVLEAIQEFYNTIKKMPPKVKKETKKRSKPKRSKVRQRVVNAGPRFGMDLGVMGSGGASVPLELLAKSGGGAMGEAMGGMGGQGGQGDPPLGNQGPKDGGGGNPP